MEDFAFTVRKRNLQIRANEVYEVYHVADVSETVGLANDELYLVVRGLDSGIAYPQTDRIEDVLFVTADLTSEIADGRYAAVTCPPEPGLQFLGSFFYIIQLQKQPKFFFDSVGTIQSWILLSNHLQAYFLVVREILRGFTESIGGTLDFGGFPLVAFRRLSSEASSRS